MNKGKVLIAAPVHPVLTEGLEAQGYELLFKSSITQYEALDIVQDCVGIVTSTRLNINKDLIDSAPLLRFIARMGSGMEVIDTGYAQAKGIRCLSSPEGNANAVAEHALGMLLALQKRILKARNEILHEEWIRDENRGEELEGKTIGIIGFGHTGRAFAKLLRGFDMHVLVYDKYVKVEPSPHYSVCTDLSEIQNHAEIISLHVPYAEENVHIVDRIFINKMLRPFILINTSRGMVLDSAILTEYLDKGRLRGLCLDVWEEEPLQKMSRPMKDILLGIVKRDDVVITPHIAGYSNESLYKMSRILLDKITI